MKKHVVILSLAALALGGCSAARYESPAFDDRAGEHRIIAVLPFEMVLTGRAPSGLTLDQIEAIEEAESLAFQSAFYLHLLDRSSARRKRPILISIQAVETSNRILREHGIGVRDSWGLDGAELARTLGVDAVVRTAVTKTRYLSDPASLGLTVGLDLLYQASEGKAPWLVPPGATKTYDIWIDSALLAGDDGEVLWRIALQRETDWTRSADDVIAAATGKLAKTFPYRD